VFHCKNNESCRSIVHAFTDSGPNGRLGREITAFVNSRISDHSPFSFPLVNPEWLPNLYGYKVAPMMVDWLTKTKRVTGDELVRWLPDLDAQAPEDAFSTPSTDTFACASNNEERVLCSENHS
jgi:hypothetical protein